MKLTTKATFQIQEDWEMGYMWNNLKECWVLNEFGTGTGYCQEGQGQGQAQVRCCFKEKEPRKVVR